jgi:pyruvate dehydrogenase E1 component beta subunit
MSTQNKNISTAEALRLAIQHSMSLDKNVVLFGEGIDDPSSMFGTTKNLKSKFPKNRIFEMPLSENLFVGAGVGAAYFGDRVIINLQRTEFLLLALEQLFNNAAKSHYISNGKLKVPIVIRVVVGRGWGQGPEHSQSLESLFSMIPGLKVMIPCFPQDSYHLMKQAIFDNNPVVFIESRWCHYNYGKIDLKKKIIYNSFNQINKGSDITVISSSYTSTETLAITKFLKKFDINVDLFDTKILRPLDLTLINKSISITKKLLVIDTGHKFLGIGSEIISQLAESGIDFKLAPIRLGMPDHPTPSSRSFINNVYVTPKKILNSILKLSTSNKSLIKKIKNEFSQEFKELTFIDIPNDNFKGPF